MMFTTSLSLWLGVTFLLVGAVNVWLILQSSARVRDAKASSRLITAHRIGGYLFVAVFAVMAYFMVARLGDIGSGTSPGVSYRDTYKIGNPDMPVLGIATTFMSTLDVLQRAHAAGLNMVVTHEPTFYSDADLIEPLKNDPMYHFKLERANKNSMVVWRFHDHWHARKPDRIVEGWNRALGWEKYLVNDDARRWNIPPTTLGAVAKHFTDSLKTADCALLATSICP